LVDLFNFELFFEESREGLRLSLFFPFLPVLMVALPVGNQYFFQEGLN
jgi:hypothetical protein